MFTEDLSLFFADFGVVATFAGGEQVVGIFDEPYARAEVGFMDAASSRPTFTLPTAALPAGPDWRSFLSGEYGAVDLRLSMRGADYLVVGHEPDGAGVSRLVLQRFEA